MILYSVTVSIEPAAEAEWLRYMREKHIPEVLASACFSGYKMFKILTTQQEGECSYSIQYFCKNLDDFERYQRDFAKPLQADHSKHFENKAFAFRTLLELV